MKVLVSNFNPKMKTVDRKGNFKSGAFELSIRDFIRKANAFYDKSEGMIKKYNVVEGHLNPNMGTDIFDMNNAYPLSYDCCTILKRKNRGRLYFYALFHEKLAGNVQNISTLFRIPEKAIVEYK